jgi:para-nitrobenzyl esterase
MPGPQVDTASGSVEGLRESGISAFLGIPYAAPPTGGRRFLPPQAPPSWAGVAPATEFGPMAMQLAGGRRSALGGGPSVVADEDCLTLNVWTPAAGGARPVLVWLHGGGYSVGNASRDLYDGANLARRNDVVVVSANHRLGLFGFLYLGELLGDRYGESANVGMLDWVAVLEWVRDNIASFGGDPDSVTIFGESGGGGKVSALLCMPRAAGLFHRAIIESGPPFQFPDLEKAAATAGKVVATLGLSGGELETLLTMDAHKLLDVQVALGAGGGPSPGGMSFAPTVDGRALPDYPEQALAGGASAEIPLIIGTNLDEARFMIVMAPHLANGGEAIDDAELLERLQPGFDNDVGPLVARYRGVHPHLSNIDLLLAIESDQFRIRSIRLAEHKVAGSAAPVYSYLFCWTTDALPGLGSFHGLEMPFVFANLTTMRGLAESPGADRLADRMCSVWGAFARTGVPAAEGLPTWQPYTLAERATMVIDAEWTLESDPLAETRQFWDDMSTGPDTRPWSRVIR